MTKFIIAHDDKDLELGSYFTNCKENLVLFLQQKNQVELTEIPTIYCNQSYIEIKIQGINNQNFCFVAYSHGNEDALVCAGESYVKVGENTHLFKNALFYTNACLTGKRLGKDLERIGCTFIGYREEVNALLWNIELAVTIDNYALLVFIEQNKTIHEAYLSMLDYYDFQIDKLNELEGWRNIGKIADLTYARDALVVYGNKNLKFSQLSSDN